MSSSNSDPLEKARDEYRKLLKKWREAESERVFLKWVVESAACVLDAAECPEALADHPLVRLASESLLRDVEFLGTFNRMLALLRRAVRMADQPALSGTLSDEWLRLVSSIRSELSTKDGDPCSPPTPSS
jgi:hypothetical protein